MRIKKYKQGTKNFTVHKQNADCLESYLLQVGLLNRQPFTPVSMNQQAKPQTQQKFNVAKKEARKMKAKIDESLRQVQLTAKPWAPKADLKVGSSKVGGPAFVESIDKRQQELVNSCIDQLGILDDSPSKKE